ncbi:MAG: MFS transporter [Bacillota bacterium]|nr:MFS transporter [Bacillota bacterium]
MEIARIVRAIAKPSVLAYLVTVAAVEFVRGALYITFLPTYLPGLGVTTAEVGLVIATQYIADNLFKAWEGSIIDRLGPWPILLPGFLLAALGVLVLSRSHSLPALLLGSLAYGLGAAGTWPAAMSGISAAAPEELRSTALSSIFVAWLAGGGLGPILVNYIPDRWVFPVLGAVILVPLAVALAHLRSLRYRGVDWRRVEWIGTTVRRVAPLIGRAWPVLPGMFLQTFAVGLILPVMAPFARQQFHISGPEYAWLMMAGGLVAVLVLLPAGWLADRLGPRPVLLAGLLIASASLVFLASRRTLGQALPAAVLLGGGYALVLPSWNGLMTRIAPDSDRGGLMGFFMTVEGAGVALGSALGGVLGTLFGLHLPLYATCSVLLAMIVVYFFLPVERFALPPEEFPGK